MIVLLFTFIFDVLVFLLFKNVIDQTVLNIFTLVVTSVVLIYVFKKSSQSKAILLILIFAYLARIGYMFFDYYANGTYMLLKDYIDSLGFHMQAEQIVNGTITAAEANKGFYTVFISYLYRVIGINKLMGQYLNVMLSMVTSLVFLKIVSALNIKQNKIAIPFFVICFFPVSILFSSIMVRESIIIFASTLSLFFFIKWFKGGTIYHFALSILSVMIAGLLHSGLMIFILVYLFILIFYNKEKKKLIVTWKSIILTVIFIVAFVLFYAVFKNILFKKFNIFKDGLNRVYRYLQLTRGDSAYLPDIKYTNLWDVVWQAPIRMFHFLFSPVPWQWRGLKDAGAFLVDSMFYLLYIVIWVPLLIKTKKENRLLFIVFSVQTLLFVLIFAHGTYTAGAAIRHRGKMITMLATTYILSKDGDPFNINAFLGRFRKSIKSTKRVSR